MAIQKILQTDTLDSGFRVKYNETADSIINGNGILDANGNIKLPKEDGTFWTIDIKSYYASKADVTEMLVPAIRLATDTVTGQVRKATLSELVNGSSDFAYISSMQLLYALENISLLVDTLKIGDNLFENGLVKLLSTDGTNTNTDIGISIVDNLGVESNYFKLINDTWTTDTGFKGDYLDFNTSSTALGAIGRLKWNDQDGTLDLGLKGGNVTLQIGQEQVLRVVNKTGATLNEADFRAVRIRDVSEGGSQGNRLAVKLAQADSDADSATTIGIVTETIGDNQEGFITTSGNISNIDTTGTKSFGGAETWNAGDILYLDPLHAGYLTNVKPQAPNHTIIVGWVINKHQNQGKIFVKVDNGYEIDELHNVKITTVADKDVLIYNNTLGVWENKSILDAGLLDGSGTANYLPKWTDSNTLTDSILYELSGKIGIGTITPASTLTVNGDVQILSINKLNFTSTAGTNYINSPIANTLAFVNNSTETFRINSSNNFLIGTTTDVGTKLAVNGNSYFNGSIGIGVSSLTNSNLYVFRNLSVSGVFYNIYSRGQIQAGVTQARYFSSESSSISGAGASIFHFIAQQGTLSGTHSSQYGFFADSSLVGATNNYGIYSAIPSGTNNWNLYMAGTAPNYMASSLGIGSTSLTGYNLRISKNITGASTAISVYQNGVVQTDVSVAYGFRNDAQSVSSITSFTDYQHYASIQGTMNTAPTNHTAFYVANLTSGANIYGFFGNLSSASTKWNLYMAGTAKNYLNGSLLIGTTTDNGYKLDVTGTGRFTGVVQFDAIPTHSLTPSLANHIVNKAYVDSLALVKRGDNVKTISLTNITLSGTQTINGVALVAGDLILVAGQTTQTFNGVYVVNAGMWTRSANNDSDAEIRGAYHFITAGTYANQRYINTNTSTINIVAGVSTTNITYAIDFGAETDPVWTAFKTENSITPTSISNWNTAYTNTTNGTFYLATNPSNYITLNSLSAGAGLSYNSATGVFSYSGTIYTDSLIRGLISGIAPISYNNTTGEISMLSANGSRDGYLTSTDWTTFNNKQNALTNPITGTGTTNYISKFSSTSALTNSIIFDNGTNVGIGTASPNSKLTIVNGGQSILLGTGTNTSAYSLSIGVNDDGVNISNNSIVRGFNFLNNNGNILTMSASRNIGIGTTTPSYKLHVAGDVNINSGSVYRINGIDVSTNWTTAYNRSITAIAISGTTTKTLTLTKQDGTTLTANFTDENSVTSVNGLSGSVVLTTSNISESSNLYFTTSRVLNTALAGYTLGQNTSILATDTILGAFNKIQAQLNAKLSSNQTITLTGDATGSGTTSIAVTLNSAYSGFTNYYTKTYIDTNFALKTHNHTLDSLSNVTITNNTNGEILKWNGTAWINNTLAEAGISAIGHTHTTSDITNLSSFTGFDTRYSLTTHNHAVDSLSDVTISSKAINDILQWNGTKWVNKTLPIYTLPTATSTILGGVKIGSGINIDVNGIISVSTNYQAPLSGTGFVKISGTTISYDNSSYYLSSNPNNFISLTSLTGAISGVLTTNLTINRVLISNNSGKIDTSSVTSIELSYLSGVTSSIQTQINTLNTSITSINSNLANYYTKTETNTLLSGYSLITHNHSLDGLSNVSINTKANNDVLQWNGTAWVNKTLSGAGISVVGHTHTTSEITNLASYSSFANYFTSSYIIANYSLITHNHTLDSLSNVTITNNTNGEILKWNGTAWINNTLAEAGISAIGHTHTTSDITNLSSYTGFDTRYYTQSIALQTFALISHTHVFNNITDVSITSPVNNNILLYNSATQKWENKTLSQAGIASISHTHNTSDIVDLASYSSFANYYNKTSIDGFLSGKENTLPTSTTAGTYRSVTVNNKGLVTAGTNPTTISGYGITDFYTQQITGTFTPNNSAIALNDTLLNALQKAQGQINNSFKKTDISSNNNYLVKFASTTNTLTQSLIFDSGSLVGIGTSAPTAGLQINSPIANSLALRSVSVAGNNYIEFLNNTGTRTSYFGHNRASNDLYYYIPSANSHRFITSAVERFIIDGSGNVGIGTSTLTYRLNIAGDINLTSGSKLRLDGSTGLDHQFLKFDGTNHVWAYLNVGELEDADSIVKYELDNGERGIKFYTADKTNNVFNNNDTLGFIFTNEDTGIFGIHGYSLNSSGNLQEYGIQIDQDTNIYRLKADGARARILTTDDIIAGGGTSGSSMSLTSLSIYKTNDPTNIIGVINETAGKLYISANSASSGIVIQSVYSGNSIKIDTNNFYIGNVRIDMNSYQVGRTLKAISAYEAQWV